jgi:ABC-2 type transport system permease protein
VNGLAGTGALLRLALRRDRIQLPVWVFGLTGVFAASASSVTGLYDTDAARLTYASTTSASAVARAFNGPISGPSLGAIVMVETYVTMAVLVALMSIFAVVRHTRQNEETGRAELLGSAVVGRYAQLTAAITVAVLANLALAGLIFAVLANAGLPATGSLLAGVAVAVTGIVFTGFAALTAQVAESTRAANGLATAAVGLAFLARAAGDAFGHVSADGLSVVSAWPSWVSPMGWAQQARPFRDDAWPLLGLPLALFVACCAAAYVLIGRRDLGTGMLPVGPGPAVASRWLLSPLGLAWRLQRGVLLGWAIGVAVTGLALGAVADEIDDMAGGNEQVLDMLERLGGAGALLDAYFAAMFGIGAIAIAAYTVQALLRPRGEEAAGHLEPVLATAVSRTRWLGGHVAVATAGAAALLVLLGATTGLAYGLVVGDPAGQVARSTGAALVWLPATLALGGFVVAVFGLVPRLAGALSWAGLAVCLVMGQIGALLELPQAVLDVSPFTHVPAVPAAEVTAAPLLWLAAAAVGLAGAGFAVFRRRDVA